MNKLILLSIFCFATQVFADPAATVIFKNNKVVAEHNGTERSLARGSSLEIGDAIITSNDALAKIKYSNGTLVTIGSNSHYKILSYTPEKEEQLKAQLEYGKIQSKTFGQKKESLKTPIVSMAILGTEFKVYVPPVSQGTTTQTYVSVSSGLVNVGNFPVYPGNSTVTTMNGTVFTPFPAAGEIPNAEAGLPQGVNPSMTSDQVSQMNNLINSQIVTTTSTSSLNNTITLIPPPPFIPINLVIDFACL